MTEINHSRPSFNGTDLLASTTESSEIGASNLPLKTSIPTQEISAVREEPVPAAAHTLPNDDQSTVAAANAVVVEENRPAAVSSSLSEEEASKKAVEGPGHESDVRELNGVGLAGHVGQMERQNNEEASRSSQPREAIVPAGESFNLLCLLFKASCVLKDICVQIQCLLPNL